jgi:hypothetical protein
MSDPSSEFRALIERLTQAICRGDGAAAAACFVPEGSYHDGFYGEFRGREAIRGMVENHFHANARDFTWTLSDALSDGSLAYARYDFSYVSKSPAARRAHSSPGSPRYGSRRTDSAMASCSIAVAWCK